MEKERGLVRRKWYVGGVAVARSRARSIYCSISDG